MTCKFTAFEDATSAMADAVELWINSGCQNHKFYGYDDAFDFAAEELVIRGGASLLTCFLSGPKLLNG